MALHLPNLGYPYGLPLKPERGYNARHLRELETARLRLRRWQEEDVEPFGRMRMDAVGMEFFPELVSPVMSATSIEQFERNFDARGYGFWAVESLDTLGFVGAVGLYPRSLPGGIEKTAIGWQLARQHWGRGYAKEAAQAVLKDGFRRLKLTEIIAVVGQANTRSQRVAESLGMKLDAQPLVEEAAAPHAGVMCHQQLYRLRPSVRR